MTSTLIYSTAWRCGAWNCDHVTRNLSGMCAEHDEMREAA